MNKKLIFALCAATLALGACNNGNNGNGSSAAADSTATDSTAAKPALTADKSLTDAAKFYADKVDSKRAFERMSKVDALLTKDMSDLQKNCTYCLYPFGGPDFMYAHHIYPNADIYFLMGLEELGTAPTTTDESKAPAYSKALINYFILSYNVTKNMETDLDNQQVDGTLPIITMLMAKDDCSIVSVKYKSFDASGNMIDAEQANANIAEVKFFSNKTPEHEQTLYYYSGNTKNEKIEPGLMAYFTNTLPKYKVGSFFKAASYLLHGKSFSNIRDAVLGNSFAILQDDSGIRYKFFDQNIWNITLYGKYKRPLICFSAGTYQADLNSAYKSSNVRPLDFRIGYSNPSNWMVARKK